MKIAYHAIAWLIWTGSVLVILSMTRNPWYVGLVLACVLTVKATLPPQPTQLPFAVWKLGLIIVTVSLIFNSLAVRFGQTVLFTINESIPLLGGPVTIEAALYGGVNGLVLTGMLAAFSVFNQAVTVRQLIRLVPQAFFPVAITVSIALTFIPITLSHYHDIRHAQAIRGHRLRGLRDWLPLFVPLLIGGLERAFQLAEAMTARGFALNQTDDRSRTQWLILSGLLLLITGWLLRLLGGYPTIGLLMLWSGVGVVGLTLWHISRQRAHTNYRPQRWTAESWLLSLTAVLSAMAFVVPFPELDRSSIFFYPYPKIAWPTFHPLLGLAIIALLTPAWLRWRKSQPDGVQALWKIKN